jgi:hypothetical protein
MRWRDDCIILYVRTYVCMYVCMYAYIYIYIYGHSSFSELTHCSVLEGISVHADGETWF